MLKRTIISLEKPKKINLSDTLPILGGKSKAVDLKDFLAETKSHGNKLEEWSEDISYEAKDKFNFIHRKEINTLTPEIIKQCQSNYSNMAVCYMGDTFGYGVFALEDFKKGQPIAMYAGAAEILNDEELIAKYHHNNLSYLLRCGVDENKNQLIINPEKRGNISRFFMHAPDKDSEELKQYEFKTDYATANMDMTAFYSNYQTVPILVANRDINKNEMFCFNYGSKYWEGSDTDPDFFDKYGRTLDKSQYKILNMHITISPKSDINKHGIVSSSLTIPEAKFEELLEMKIPLTCKINDTRLTVSAAELRDARQKNPNSHHLSFETANFELGINAYGIASCGVLKKLTGANWQYSPDNNILIAMKVSTEKFDNLKNQGLKLIRVVSCSNPSMMFSSSSIVTIIDLNDKTNLEKLVNLISPQKNTEKMSLST